MVDCLLLAQEVKEVTQAVPAELFNWIVAAFVIVITALAATVIYLFRRLNKSVLPEEITTLIRKEEVDHQTIIAGLGTQATIDTLQESLRTEQIERRQDIERLMGEQKDILQRALENQVNLVGTLDDVVNLLGQVKEHLEQYD